MAPNNVTNLSDYLPAIHPASPGLKSSSGSGTSGGMDGWQTSVENRLGEIRTELTGVRSDMRTDFRAVFAAVIAVAIGLAGIMAKGFHWF
jgi:hypothetical protein